MLTKETHQLSGTADKPIIFLCHSLGGIIVKRVGPDPQNLPVTSHPLSTHT
jgi:predicted alpha/beta hydrolase family esterase